jgi:uncharacterized protein
VKALPPPGPWLHPSLVVADSVIEGYGLLAEASLTAGTVLWRLGGRIVARAEFQALLTAVQSNPEAPYLDAITVDGEHDLVLPAGSPVHFGNHSCQPNAWWADGFTVTARRDIPAGDEVTTDYATSTDHPDFVMACSCGAKACRATVTGNDWRLPELQSRYAGHWIPWLEQRIAASRRNE